MVLIRSTRRHAVVALTVAGLAACGGRSPTAAPQPHAASAVTTVPSTAAPSTLAPTTLALTTLAPTTTSTQPPTTSTTVDPTAKVIADFKATQDALTACGAEPERCDLS